MALSLSSCSPPRTHVLENGGPSAPLARSLTTSARSLFLLAVSLTMAGHCRVLPPLLSVVLQPPGHYSTAATTYFATISSLSRTSSPGQTRPGARGRRRFLPPAATVGPLLFAMAEPKPGTSTAVHSQAPARPLLTAGEPQAGRHLRPLFSTTTRKKMG